MIMVGFHHTRIGYMLLKPVKLDRDMSSYPR